MFVLSSLYANSYLKFRDSRSLSIGFMCTSVILSSIKDCKSFSFCLKTNWEILWGKDSDKFYNIQSHQGLLTEFRVLTDFISSEKWSFWLAIFLTLSDHDNKHILFNVWDLMRMVLNLLSEILQSRLQSVKGVGERE
jgi:hypothetical protein